MTEDAKPAAAIIGAGAVGTALARRLAAGGLPVAAVLSRTEAQARALASLVGAPLASASLRDLPGAVSVVCCCVPDDALGGLARALRPLRRDWSGTLVLHTSGTLPAAALDGLAQRGALTLSFHPLQTFPAGSTPDAFEGIFVALEGEDEAVRRGADLVRLLGAHPFLLSAAAKARYHLAASMASNFFVTLMALVGEVFSSIGVDRGQGAALVRPLVEGTWRNLAHAVPEDVLTGPIARGDSDTVAGHVRALTEHLPHLLPTYAALATETVRLAVRSGRLAPPEAQRVLDVLHAALEPRDPLF